MQTRVYEHPCPAARRLSRVAGQGTPKQSGPSTLGPDPSISLSLASPWQSIQSLVRSRCSINIQWRRIWHKHMGKDTKLLPVFSR